MKINIFQNKLKEKFPVPRESKSTFSILSISVKHNTDVLYLYRTNSDCESNCVSLLGMSQSVTH